ncbi:stage II sporulation protein R [Edaphobacillus lindanitolerans]|uniref:Stage II sporulation protein R n=1 Tax=Edaphobacillus lindanitolerans TaxID=550447 RepID=A0A1U7PLT1_9BACI|nr:stage II sporulation protein R [Edaphobacillus lindanitolerans]SIT69654.1 stage II sporulation protein R [Edaphobacillus lindanitolerans]
MLNDYPINQSKRMQEKLRAAIPFIQFILMLIVIQCALFLLTGTAAEEAEGMLRIRVIADSNTESAQSAKREIVALIAPAVEQARSESRTPEELAARLDTLLPGVLAEAGEDVTLRRGSAVFPPKPYRGGILAQQEADAWVVTIGDGRGDNWWCALFPDVCDPPEETATAMKEETEEEPVTFFLVEWLKGLFG